MSNNFIKSNPYVFPFQEFKDLTNKKLNVAKSSKTINFNEVTELLQKFTKSISIDLSPFMDKNTTTEERLFAFFISDTIRFGELQMYLDNKEKWIKKFSKALEDKKFNFSILGLPFKVPIPLKTKRKNPDFAELMAIARLEYIGESIEKITGTKTTINAVTEGAFAKFVNADVKAAEYYGEYLKETAKTLGYTHLNILPLNKMEEYVDNFDELFKKKVAEFTKKHEDKDPSVIEKVEGALPIINRIVKPESTDVMTLMNVYNFDIPNDQLSSEEKRVREALIKFALPSSFEYFSYLELRDDLNFLQKEFGENYLPLTVSPKANRLGIIPIHQNITVLPHHGVPVYDQKNEIFNIMYLIDVLQTYDFIEAHLENDDDTAPFLYLI